MQILAKLLDESQKAGLRFQGTLRSRTMFPWGENFYCARPMSLGAPHLIVA